jgi:hypothetical protein
MRALLVVLLSGLLLANAVNADEKESKKKVRLDLGYQYDPQDLHEYWRKSQRWKRLFRRFGLGSYHIPPSHENGPYAAPPLRIWGTGFGASLWRDPVTGRPIM